MIRLDKILSHMGYGSRKEVKQIIRKGFVLVNGEVIVDDDFKVCEDDDIVIFDNTIEYKEKVYIMLNKPDGVISATFDPRYNTVLDLIGEYEKMNLFPVGRLDIDTVGLLLITNDGKLAHELLSPKKHVDKKYYVEFDGIFKEEYIEEFKKGITLDDGYKCMSALCELISDNKAYLTIKEGKYHQVKRMFASLDMNVTFLKRISFGSLVLDEKLNESEWRLLTENEINSLKSLTN